MQKGRRHNRQLHNRPNIALRLAAVLLIMVCISTWMMDGLFAKYRTSDSGGDSARVIKFGNLTMTESGDFPASGGQAYLIPGVDIQKQATVTFTGSESATYVFVEVELPAHWTSTSSGNFSAFSNRVSWSVGGNWKHLKLQDETTTQFVYYQEVEPNTEFTDVFINKGLIEVDEKIKKSDMEDIEKLADSLEIKLRAVVAQSNGFASPKEAWESISHN